MPRSYPSDSYTPKPEHHFTFGLWTVGNPGRDPFGHAVREPLSPTTIVRELAKLGAYGVNFHDDDLIPPDSSPAQRDRIIKEFQAALDETGLKVPMATTNLFSDPVFKDGAFTSNDARVRAFALQKTIRAIELGVQFGAEVYVFWGGREGVEVNASKDPRVAVERFKEALDFLTSYVKDRKYNLRFALEAKPNEPRGDLFLPTTGHMLAFIETLEHAEMVGVNPETAHEQMAGLDFSHGIGQALAAGKLFHIDLNGQKPGRYDQDLRFGSDDIKASFYLVKLLEDAQWPGMRHFDSHPYRTEDLDGVWDFAYYSMRTYLLLKEKAERFRKDKDIQQVLADIKSQDSASVDGLTPPFKYGPEAVKTLENASIDVDTLRRKGYGYEHLDQLVTELLLGVR